MKKIKLLFFVLFTIGISFSACKNERRAAAEAAAAEAKKLQDLAAQEEALRADSIEQANAAALAAQNEAEEKKRLAEEKAAARNNTKKNVTPPSTEPKKSTSTAATKPKPPVKPATKPAPKPATTAGNKPKESPIVGGTADQFDNSSNVIKRSGKDDVLTIADVKPSYEGGEAAMMKYLNKYIKYPAVARENGIKGTVFVKFVVEKTGEVTDVSVAKGVHPTLDAEASRVVKSMPKWTPGKQSGKPVAVQYTLPVKFELID
jgi:protein TonB